MLTQLLTVKQQIYLRYAFKLWTPMKKMKMKKRKKSERNIIETILILFCHVLFYFFFSLSWRHVLDLFVGDFFHFISLQIDGKRSNKKWKRNEEKNVKKRNCHGIFVQLQLYCIDDDNDIAALAVSNAKLIPLYNLNGIRRQWSSFFKEDERKRQNERKNNIKKKKQKKRNEMFMEHANAYKTIWLAQRMHICDWKINRYREKEEKPCKQLGRAL